MSEFKQAIESALSDPTLSGSLTRFSEAYRISRARAYEGIDFSELRGQIAERKGYAAAHMGDLVQRFMERAEAAGATVFLAKSPEAARNYVLSVARRNNARLAVKSKSMASEEIHLSRAE